MQKKNKLLLAYWRKMTFGYPHKIQNISYLMLGIAWYPSLNFALLRVECSCIIFSPTSYMCSNKSKCSDRSAFRLEMDCHGKTSQWQRALGYLSLITTTLSFLKTFIETRRIFNNTQGNFYKHKASLFRFIKCTHQLCTMISAVKKNTLKDTALDNR